MPPVNAAVLSELRQKIEGIENLAGRVRTVLPFGVSAIDSRLPNGGLPVGALHEIAGGANGAIDGAVAMAFAAGIAARTGGMVLWCHTQPDLFAPSLAECGLSEDRVVFFEGSETEILGAFEKAVAHGGPTAVVAEMANLSPLASKRIQMAAETSGTMALAVRRWRRPVDARDFGQATAAFTRWRVTELSSLPLPVRGVGRARWHVEMMRCRNRDCADFEVEACNAQGFIDFPAALVNGPVETGNGRHRAAV
jgi:protein ImuA